MTPYWKTVPLDVLVEFRESVRRQAVNTQQAADATASLARYHRDHLGEIDAEIARRG